MIIRVKVQRHFRTLEGVLTTFNEEKFFLKRRFPWQTWKVANAYSTFKPGDVFNEFPIRVGKDYTISGSNCVSYIEVREISDWISVRD